MPAAVSIVVPNRRLLPRATLAALAMALGACADPCLDDGLGQSACPVQQTDGASGSTGETDSNSNTISDSDSASATLTAGSASMSASASDTDTDSATASASASATDSASASDSASDSGSASDSEGGTQWCPDADMDGFGDPEGCVNAMDPPPGTVDNDDDCDDGDADTFPGAAPNDDATACMHDGDGDDWGDDNPGPGVDAGTDCDDEDAETFPGAAEAEADPTQCSTDADGDGWGDANPSGTAVPGADCFDGNDALNPSTMALTAFVNQGFQPVVATASTLDAALSTVAPLDTPFQWNPVSATIDETGLIVLNNDSQNRLYSVEYLGVCDGSEAEGTTTALPQSHGIDVFCGLGFGVDGLLYGVQNATDEVAEFDPTTGAVLSSVPLTLGGTPFDAGSCGMTFDCHTQRLLYAHGPSGDIFALDPVAGTLELVADTAFTWSPTGLAYDPVDRVVWVAGDTTMYRVAIDGSNTVEEIGNFDFGPGGDVSVSNIETLPVCVP